MSAGSETKICPKCHYKRTPADTAPDWECPGCGIVYANYGTDLHGRAHGFNPEFPPRGPHDLAQSAPPRFHAPAGGIKWVLIVIVLGACVWISQPVWKTQSSKSVAAAASTTQPTVVLYGTDWCPYCARTRVFFAANGIQYADLDIEKSAEAGQRYRELGGTGVPLIVVGDRVYRGYSEELMRDALGPWLKNRDHQRDPPDERAHPLARDHHARPTVREPRDRMRQVKLGAGADSPQHWN